MGTAVCNLIFAEQFNWNTADNFQYENPRIIIEEDVSCKNNIHFTDRYNNVLSKLL
jgi:hypothetical protein